MGAKNWLHSFRMQIKRCGLLYDGARGCTEIDFAMISIAVIIYPIQSTFGAQSDAMVTLNRRVSVNRQIDREQVVHPVGHPRQTKEPVL
jgi:hypothetical protein